MCVCVLHSTQIVLSDKAKRVESFNRALCNSKRIGNSLRKRTVSGERTSCSSKRPIYMFGFLLLLRFFGTTVCSCVRCVHTRASAWICVFKRSKKQMWKVKLNVQWSRSLQAWMEERINAEHNHFDTECNVSRIGNRQFTLVKSLKCASPFQINVRTLCTQLKETSKWAIEWARMKSWRKSLSWFWFFPAFIQRQT